MPFRFFLLPGFLVLSFTGQKVFEQSIVWLFSNNSDPDIYAEYNLQINLRSNKFRWRCHSYIVNLILVPINLKLFVKQLIGLGWTMNKKQPTSPISCLCLER